MPYDKLIKAGQIKPYHPSKDEVRKLLKISHRDLDTAIKNLEVSPDWAYSIAYNAVLQASRALLFAEGYRTRGGEQHAAVVEFVRERLGQTYSPQVQLFDQMRRKRNHVIYDLPGVIGKAEAAQAITFAQEFVEQLQQTIVDQLNISI